MVDNPKDTKSETAAPGESGSALRAGADAPESLADVLIRQMVDYLETDLMCGEKLMPSDLGWLDRARKYLSARRQP